MGVESMCNAVANAIQRDFDKSGIMLAQVSGRSYPYTVAVDIPIDDGDWVYVMLTDNRAVVVGK